MKKTITLVLDNLRSVENTASIFRTGDGLGVSKIFLVGTTPAPLDRFGRKRNDFAKVSLGAEDSVEWEYVSNQNLKSQIQSLKEQGFQIIALEQHPKAKKLEAKSYKLERLTLIVGNEVDGVSKEALELSDKVVEIPMEGKKESLNVSVATGIALFMLR